MEICTTNYDKVLSGNEKWVTFIKEERKLANSRMRSLMEDDNFNEELMSFLKKVLINNWLDYQTLKVYEKSNENYDDQLRAFYEKVIVHFPTDLKDALEVHIKINNFLKDELYKSDDFLEEYKCLAFKEISKEEIVDIMLSENYVDKLKVIFEELDNYLDKESQPELNTLLFGRTGAGKTTIASIIEGYFCTLNNEIPVKRIISNNGRGTDSFSKSEIRVGKILLNVCDFTGFSDPGKGFENSLIFNQLLDELNSNSKGQKIDLDTILYSLDLSIPRLDLSDYELLLLFMKQMQKVYDNLDYWKNVILVLTKANLVKLTKYEKFGGLPEYKIMSYLKDVKKEFSDETVFEYNQIYGEALINVMEEWRDLIRERQFKKVFDNRICDEDNGQSFNIYFKKIAKELYSDLSDEYIESIFTIICSNTVIAGDVEKDISKESWDFRNCKIKRIPNFDDALNEYFEFDDYDQFKDLFTISTNWFSTLQNKINLCSKSTNFKLTVAKLNSMRIDLDEDTNNGIFYDSATTDNINQSVEQVAEDSVLDNIINGSVSFLKGFFFFIFAWFDDK